MIVRAAVPVLLAPLLLGAAWAVGFDAYDRESRRVAPAPEPADGIVVLTGGADRIERALHLLAEGKAPALLVSGVGRGAEMAELAHRVQLDPATLGDRVTLGHLATTTVGNAAETAAWARRNGVHRLIVVTAGYHMPRALREIGHDLPGVELLPDPVQPPAMRGPPDPATLRLLANEYDKLLAVRHRPASAHPGLEHSVILLRSAVFNLWFFGITFVLGVVGVFVRAFAPRRALPFAQFWARSVLAGARTICGIHVRVTGEANLPRGPALIVSQHQSAFDTLVWVNLVPRVSYVFKAELARIPLFGPMLLAAGQIPLDRGASVASVRKLLRAAERAKADQTANRDIP